MTTSTEILSGDQIAETSPASLPCVLVASPTLATGTVVACNPGDDVVTKLGGRGLAADVVSYLLRRSNQRVLAAVADATWSPAPSVTHKDASGGNSPTGPTVTCALDSGMPGCLDDHTVVVRVESTTQISIAYDGSTFVETVPIPQELPAVLTGTVDLAAASYPLTALSSEHIDFTSPVAGVITWTSAPTSAQDVVDSFNTLAAAVPAPVYARLKQDTDGHAYFELVSTGAGASLTLTIDTTVVGSAKTTLGFTASSNDSDTGAAATLSLPASGLKLTFPATGDYVEDETYTMACVGPRTSIAARVAASLAAYNQFTTYSYGFVGTIDPTDTAPNASATVDAFEEQRAAWLADTAAPVDLYFVVGGPWHTASSTRATNETNITTTDNTVVAAFANATANPNSVALDDCYIPGTIVEGKFRRSASVPWILKRAAAPRLAATVSEGSIPETVLVGPDGLTRARNENTATLKLAGLDGPGFFVLKTMADGVTAKFALGATRAGNRSRLRHDGDFAVACETARIIQSTVEAWEAERPETDEDTGMIAEPDRASRQEQVYDALEPTLRPTKGLVNCTSFKITLSDPATGLFVDNGKTPVKASLTTLGTIQEVLITVAMTGTTITEPTST